MELTLEYVWIGAHDTHSDLRSKTRTITIEPIMNLSSFTFEQINSQLAGKIPDWNFDGSSTGQASSDQDTEVILKPCCLCLDPFRKEARNVSLIVLCDCYIASSGSLIPHSTNTRVQAVEIFRQLEKERPWFGLEQEYVLKTMEGLPIGWSSYSVPEPQGKYYCGIGSDKIFVRTILEQHYQACLYSGLSISGYNAEVMPGQYEFQIGPVEGIRAADQLIIARYILARIVESHDLIVDYSPKSMKGDWNGSGLHHNYSTERMREEGGFAEIMSVIPSLEKKHKEHLAVYGSMNELRLTNMENFSYGVGTRNTSIRIPNTTKQENRGYFEDRRPSANVDPYLSTSILAQTCSSKQ